MGEPRQDESEHDRDHPDTDQQNIADIIVSKHRNGPTGVVQLFFRKRLAQFLDAETRQQSVNLG